MISNKKLYICIETFLDEIMINRIFIIISTLLVAMFVLPSCDKGDNPVAYVDFTHLDTVLVITTLKNNGDDIDE